MPRVDGGLEIVALDGDVAARLQRAMRSSRCGFSVRVRGALDEARVARILAGELDDGSRLTVESVEPVDEDGESSNRWYETFATGASGKSIRQLFERQGCVVSRVLRIALGPLSLTRDLPRGRFRPATDEELALLGVEAPAADAARGRPEQRDVRASKRLGRSRRGGIL
jgi:23S rRNA pseudouridine2605 synthase